MGLKNYRRKRDFSRTPEPVGRAGRSDSGRLYVIQKHAARRLHYDFRLEMDGTLKSWAIPKGPSLDPGEKRLAVLVEDHPIEYGSFEGVIPEDQYGGGTVMLWDRGSWQPAGDPQEGFRKGRLKFRLHGGKLGGTWALARMHGEAGGEGKNWLLIKKKDSESRPVAEFDILNEQPLSLASGRSMQEIADERDRVWLEGRSVEAEPLEQKPVSQSRNPLKAAPPAGKIDPSGLPNARKAVQPEKLKPQLATLVTAPPRGANWLHEIKYDGYRIICVLKGRKASLLTRHGNNWTRKFPEVARAAESLPIEQAVLDGEIVVLTRDGTTDFQALQNVLKGVQSGRLIYYLFDLPFCQGYDLTQTPLLARKQLLRKILEGMEDSVPSIRFGDYILGQGPTVFQHACQFAVEGLVSKRADSQYVQKRSRSWVKIKCLKRQEFVVGGYTDPSGSRKGFGALLLGYYDESGDLIFSGRVGTGFNEQSLSRIEKELERIERAGARFRNPPAGREARGVHWVEPKLVAEVEFSGWTNDNLLRHPSFKGLRQDKKPGEVVREKPVAPPTSGSAAENRPEEETPPESPPVNAYRPRTGRPVRVAGVSLSNPDRILYPEMEVTKLDLALFYERIADWILPYLVKRPLVLVRCPTGHQKNCFYQKHLDKSLPDTMRGIPVEEKGSRRIYSVIDDLRGLISLVQLGVLEIHPWNCRDDRIDRPDLMVFDLDPSPEIAWDEVVIAAGLLHDKLQMLGLESFLKTSGGKGLHVVVPLERRSDWDEVKSFSKAVAESMVRSEPRKYLATMSKAKRKGKIFIDYIRNSRGATSVAAYSTRARFGAPVSTPLHWDELSADLRSDSFTISNLEKRLASLKKDPWQMFFDLRQSITAAMKREVGP